MLSSSAPQPSRRETITQSNEFFLHNNPAKWTYKEFRQHASQYHLESPRHAYKACLYQICKRKPPFTNFSQKNVHEADKFLRAASINRDYRKCPQVPRIPRFSIKQLFSGSIPGDIFFPFNSKQCENLKEADVDYLRGTIPRLSKLPPKFDEFMQAHAPFFSTHDFRDLPRFPGGRSPAESDLWVYIQTAAMHFCRHFPKIQYLSLSHAEGWTDINIWGPLIDQAFLFSESLSLDRKELQSINIKTNVIPSFDGIIHNPSSTRERRLDIGFVEVKPARVPYPKDSTDDRNKIIRALTHALNHLHQQFPSVIHKVLVIGVVCNGFTMTVLQAWMPDIFKERKVIFMKEDHFQLEMSSVPRFLEICWQIKLGLEKTLEICQSVTPMNPSL